MSELFCPKCNKEIIAFEGDVVTPQVEAIMQKIRKEGKIPFLWGCPPVGYKPHCPVCQTLIEEKR